MAWRRLLHSYSRPGIRRYSSYGERLVEEEKHAVSTAKTWRNISLFFCVPTVGYIAWKTLIGGNEHHSYTYTPWSHLRIRTKQFPWGNGDTSLFHNPHSNPGPEIEVETEVAGTPAPTFKEKIGKLWIQYLHEDIKKRDEERWNHLAKMQRVHEEHLARKKAKEIPINPMDLVGEFEARKPNRAQSGIDH